MKKSDSFAEIVFFGSFGNEPMQSCSVHRVVLSLSVSLLLASASQVVISVQLLPVTALIIETSYLTNVCIYTSMYMLMKYLVTVMCIF